MLIDFVRLRTAISVVALASLWLLGWPEGRSVPTSYAHIGPEVADRAKRFAGNNLACGNCHLQAGTKKFGIPLFGLFGKFPHYNARLGAQMTIEDRLNACLTRS